MTVTSTLDTATQQAVTEALQKLSQPEYARAAGLYGEHLLSGKEDLSRIVYSFTLYEHRPHGNLLRVNTDNYTQPLDINDGIRLDLGSTAKLRTLVHYLALIAEIYQRYAGQSPQELRALTLDRRDYLSRWVVERLQVTPQPSLVALLDAALERRYSASPGESFFTGGGLHTFANFNDEDDSKIMSVRQALRDSVNLVYIRVMRDIVYHYLYRPGAIASQLEADDGSQRRAYLERFADREGQVYLRRFYAKYRFMVAFGDSLKWCCPDLLSHPRTAGLLPRTSGPHTPPRRCRYAWLRGHCMALWLLTWACGLREPLAGSQHKAAAEEVEARPAKHLALHHFEAIDMSLDRARIPGERHSGFDRLVILVEPGREASYGVHRTCGGAREPEIELHRLTLTDQRGKVLREGDRLSHLGLLRTQHGELLAFRVGALRLASQHQPGGSAWGQRLAEGLRHRWQGLARATVPRGQALGLPQPAGIGGDYPIAPRIATLAEVAKQPHGGVAPRIPALEEIRLIGVEATVPAIATPFAPRKRGAPEVALDGAQTQPDVLGNGRGGPALVVQSPDLRIQRLPAGLALHGALLCRQGDVMRWHRHGHRPIRQRYGLLVHQGIDRVECLAIRAEHLVQGFPEILQQMKTVRDLRGCRSPLPRALAIGGRAIARDDRDPWMLPEPLGQGIGRALREERHGLPALQVHQDRAIGLPFAQGEIVHPQHPRRGQDGLRQPAEQAQQRVPAHHQSPRVAEMHPRLAPQGDAEGDQALSEPQRAPSPGSRHGGEAFGEDTTRTGAIAAKPLADAQLEAYPILRPGQVGQGAPIVTMDASRWRGAQRTGGAGRRRLHTQGDLRRSVVDVTRLKAQERGIR